MSGAYVFIEDAERDWYLNRKDLSTCEGEVTRRRAALIYLEDTQLAEKMAAGLQHEHGISGYEYDGYRTFEAKRVTDLSPEDAALAMHVDEKERPEWLQPWTDRAKKLAEFHEHPSSAKDEPEATMNESPSEVPAVERECESNHSDDTGTTRSQRKQDVTDAEPEWSVPMTKTELTKRLVRGGVRGDRVRPRKVEGILKERYGLEHIRGYQWRVRLDKMDPATRKRFEKAATV